MTVDISTWPGWTLADPQLGMPLLGLRHPADWKPNGEVSWTPQHTESPERHWFEVTHPGQRAAVQGWPRFEFTWPGGMPWQPNGYGRTYLPPEPPDRLLGTLLPQLLGQGAQQPTRFEVHPLPDWAEKFNLPPDQITPGVTYTGLRALIEAPINGEPWAVEVLALHFSVSNPGIFGAFTNHGLFVTVLRAAVAEAQALFPVLNAIADSVVPNPGWLAAVNQVGQQNAEAFAGRLNAARWASFQAEQAGIAAVGAAAADLRNTQRANAQAHFDQVMAPPPVASGAPGVSAQEAWRNELGGVEAIEDPNSSQGNVTYVSSSTAVTWQNELGEVIETDDVNFDPNLNSHNTWKIARRYDG